MIETEKVDTILFDLGGVLINWNPRNLYSKIFDDVYEMEHFLAEVATMDWNERQDAGRPFEEAIDLLVEKHPQYQMQIQAYFYRWREMLNGPIEGTVEILKALKEKGTLRIYALTNWSAQTFPIAQEQFSFLNLFEGILVSGEERMKKPHPDIYKLTIERFNLNPGSTLFIDDSLRNVEGAIDCGLQAIQFESPSRLRNYLIEKEIL